MKKLLSCSMLLGLLAPAALGQQPQQPKGDLVADAEQDTIAIAEQLYLQATSTPDDHSGARAAVLNRAEQLFAHYTNKSSPHYGRAAYMRAVCMAENGKDATALLSELAKGPYGEYTAAAAYRLGSQALARNQWESAISNFNIVQRTSTRQDLRNDALYRTARAQLKLGQRDKAESAFQQLKIAKDVSDQIYNASLMALANMYVEDGKDNEAYLLFCSLLEADRHLDSAMRGTATLQAARLASRLGKSEEAQKFYSKLTAIPEMRKYEDEAQLERILALYKKQDYQGVIRVVTSSNRGAAFGGENSDPEKNARRALIVGQSYMELKDYEKAAPWFLVAETAMPGSNLAADASYRRLICSQQMRSEHFFTHAEKHIATYAGQEKPTANLPCNDLVRLMYADRMMLADVHKASRQFDAINLNNLPESIRPDAEYKKAWCASLLTLKNTQELVDPSIVQPIVSTLDHFISTYKNDPHMPDALALRGTALLKMGKKGQAIEDFETVTKNYPNSEIAPMCWQKAAQASAANNPEKMIEYYQRLIKHYEGATKNNSKVNPPPVAAEAHYNIARALYDKGDLEGAIHHFSQARPIDPKRYGSMVDQSLVQCYFKLKDADRLREALKKLKQDNFASYNGLPPAILRWCGWTCFLAKNYALADEFLSDAVDRGPRETYTDENGEKRERPSAEPLVWKTLARSRLELRRYPRGLEAADYYLSMENQPYRRAEGMRDKACLLIGLGRSEEARKLCEEAIGLGIDGPIKSSLFITLGDAWYVEKQYSEAAKYYGRTANIVSDKELKPLAIYKIICALNRSQKEGEAAQYKETLSREFPGWTPSTNVKSMMEAPDTPTPPAATPAS